MTAHDWFYLTLTALNVGLVGLMAWLYRRSAKHLMGHTRELRRLMAPIQAETAARLQETTRLAHEILDLMNAREEPHAQD